MYFSRVHTYEECSVVFSGQNNEGEGEGHQKCEKHIIHHNFGTKDPRA
jgi:hypothetical protein